MTQVMRWFLGFSGLFLSLLITASLRGEKPARIDRYGDSLPTGAVARIGTARFADRDSAYAAVGYSPDGELLAAVDSLGNIDIWSVKAGKRQRSFGPPEGKRPPGENLDLVTNWPYASWQAYAFFSPDGKTLLTGSDHWPVRLWDVSSGKELAVMEGSKGGVLGLAVAPDFKTVAAAGKQNTSAWPFLVPDGWITLWDVASGKARRRWRSDGEKVWALAWSHDGKTLASGDDDRCVRFWGPGTGKPKGKLAGFGSAVVGVAYSSDGKTLATADMDRNLALWGVAGNRLTRKWRVEVPPNSNGMPPGWPSLGAILFTPGGKRLLTRDLLNNCPVDAWEVPSGKRLWRFPVNVGSPASPGCAASPDGGTLATVQPGRFYDLATGKQHFESPGWCVDGLQFLPGGRTLVTNERDLWDTATGEKLRGLDVRLPAAVSPDGKHFVEWGREALSLRDLATGREVRSLPTKPGGAVWPLVFAADGRTLAAFGGPPLHEPPGRHTSVWFWDVASGAEQRPIRLSSCPRPVSRVVLSADARLVAGLGEASGGKGARPGEKAEGPAGPCYLWDRASGQKKS
jgi:WD40 repeat protein